VVGIPPQRTAIGSYKIQTNNNLFVEPDQIIEHLYTTEGISGYLIKKV